MKAYKRTITMAVTENITTEQRRDTGQDTSQDTAGQVDLTDSQITGEATGTDPSIVNQSQRGERASEISFVRESLDLDTLAQLRDIESQISPDASAKLVEAFGRDVFKNNPERIAEVVSSLHDMLEADLGEQNATLEGKNVDAVESTIVAMADFGTIHQGLTSNCTVTAFSVKLCAEQPWEYARIVSELSVDGSTTLQGGQEMTLYQGAFGVDTTRPSYGFNERSVANQIFQDSAMSFTHAVAIDGLVPEGNWIYNAETMKGELYVDGELVKSQAGLYPPQFQTFYQQLFDVQADRIDTQNMLGLDTDAPTGAEMVERMIERGGLIPIETLRCENHEVLFEKVVTDGFGNDWVKIRNSWENLPPQEDLPPGVEIIRGVDENGPFELIPRAHFERTLLAVQMDRTVPRDQMDITVVTEMGERMNARPPHIYTDNDGVENVILHPSLLSFLDNNPKEQGQELPDSSNSSIEEEDKSATETESEKLTLYEEVGDRMQELVWYTSSEERARASRFRKDEDDFLSI